MFEKYGFSVPNELELHIDGDTLDAHKRWQQPGVLYDEHTGMHYAQDVELGDGRRIRAAVLYPWPYDRSNNQDLLVLNLPHAQTWKRSMYIRAELARQIVAPQSPMVVFPNNSLTSRYYDLSSEELSKVAAGDLAPLAELQVRALEKLRLGGKVALTGYSLGGLLAPAIAAVGSDKFEITHINTDEAPNKPRSAKELRQDFMKSGGFKEQRQSMADADIPVLDKVLNPPRLVFDYVRFAGSTLANKENQALNLAMTAPKLYESLEKARDHYPGVAVKIGYVAGSKLVDPNHLRLDGVFRNQFYRGEATHGHATGDNVMAHALMVKDGLVH